MTFRNSNTVEGFTPSEDPENTHLTPDKAKELDKRAAQVDKALGWAAHNGVQKELLDYVSGEVERLRSVHEKSEVEKADHDITSS